MAWSMLGFGLCTVGKGRFRQRSMDLRRRYAIEIKIPSPQNKVNSRAIVSYFCLWQLWPLAGRDSVP